MDEHVFPCEPERKHTSLTPFTLGHRCVNTRHLIQPGISGGHSLFVAPTNRTGINPLRYQTAVKTARLISGSTLRGFVYLA
ncbi:hypothetical protein JOB18_044734 [Solea senegalensis]|uniref:Uncharacterized protein n=1 Tax=Solea senegalensis TaxID=28829 RepID=A0AAV6SAC9_SOLSE|nr:hypothetical protein JOB18_044734 [Solea senegalensis]